MSSIANQPTSLGPVEDQGFTAFQAFVRGCRRYVEGGGRTAAWHSWRERGAAPATPLDATQAALDGAPGFQLHGWAYRNLQRFKYRHPQWGLQSVADRERAPLEGAIEAAAQRAIADGTLELDATVTPPDYFSNVDFHQHTDGVGRDPLAGLVYDMARRTTIPAHLDPDDVYRMIFASLPADAKLDRVMDWGCGHGSGLLTFLDAHPDSEGVGVDIAAPCLKLTALRAEERGHKVQLAQRDLADLRYPDASFDLLFFLFVLHEIPPAALRAVLAEARRVLKPGGRLFGAEFVPTPGDSFARAMLLQVTYANNEPFAPAFFEYPFEKVGREVGFKDAKVRDFDRLAKNLAAPSGSLGEDVPPPFSRWVLLDFLA